MNENQIRLLETSFAEVAEARDAAATLFYERLFANDPALKALFQGANMAEQGRKLMAALSLTVGSLRKLDALVPVLRTLAARHVAYGVRQAHYATVGTALIETLSLFFGSRFTAELRAAWIEAYGTVSAVMIAAAYGENARPAVAAE